MPKLRVVTFNIAHGRGLAPLQGMASSRKIRYNLRRISELLVSLKPDVVALQEIDQNSRWAGNFDHLDYLRLHAGFPHAIFGINNHNEGMMNLSYGNAILSKHPIAEWENVVFGSRWMGEKGFLYTEIELGDKRMPMVNLHLHHSSRIQRMKQLDRLTGWLAHKHRERSKTWTVPPIVCGDFNSSHAKPDATSSLLSHLGDYADYALHPVNGRTFPSPLPSRALDFVFLPPGCSDVKSEVVKSFLSDHRPVVVDFEL